MEHYIESAGIKSTDMGLILENAEYGELAARTGFISLPYRQGALNVSAPGGKMYFERRTIAYTFVCHAADTVALSMQLSEACSWFAKLTGVEVYDSIRRAFFEDVQLVRIGSPEYIGMAKNTARLTVTVSAEPYMKSSAGGEDML